MLPPYTLDPQQQPRLPAGPDSSRFGALIPMSTDLVPGGAYGWPQTAPVVATAPNLSASNILHSLRRKWWIGAGLGLLVGIGAAIGAWYLVPVKQEASIFFHIHRNTDSPLDGGHSYVQKDEYEAFKNTQANMVRHKPNLEAALAQIDPDSGLEISRLPEVLKHPDPVTWLEDTLEIDFPPETEFMIVKLKGEDAKQLFKVVNEVCGIYLTKVTESLKQAEKKQLDDLRAKRDKTKEESASTEEKLNNLSESLGVLDKESLQANFQSKLQRQNQLNAQLNNWQARLSEIEIDNYEDQAKLEHARNREPSDGEIEDELMKDKAYEEKVKRRDFMKEALGELETKTKRADAPALVRARESLEKIEQQIEEYKEEKRPLIRERMSSPSVVAQLTGAITARGQAAEGLTVMIDAAKKEVDLLQKQIDVLGKRSPEVEALRNRLSILHDNARTMEAAILKAEIAEAKRNRIERYGDTMDAERSSDLVKYMAVAFAGFFGFCVPMVGITFWDFQQHRVNHPTDASTALGMKTLGALPSLAGRKAKAAQAGKVNAKSLALQRSLADSVDGVRTALLRDSSAEGTRVVLVTSAVHHEGKTTLATQLATSLARAGKRTLLFDGDLRKPTAHRVFGMSLDPGLCEVMRGECEIEETIRPTRASGLWMITAGRCDEASLQDLAKDVLGEIFAQLRNGFDYIIVDASPVLATADALVIGQYVDAAVLSVLRDASRVPTVFEAADRLRGVGIRVLGTVFNGMKREVHPQTSQKQAKQKQIAAKPAKTPKPVKAAG